MKNNHFETESDDTFDKHCWSVFCSGFLLSRGCCCCCCLLRCEIMLSSTPIIKQFFFGSAYFVLFCFGSFSTVNKPVTSQCHIPIFNKHWIEYSASEYQYNRIIFNDAKERCHWEIDCHLLYCQNSNVRRVQFYSYFIKTNNFPNLFRRSEKLQWPIVACWGIISFGSLSKFIGRFGECDQMSTNLM